MVLIDFEGEAASVLRALLNVWVSVTHDVRTGFRDCEADPLCHVCLEVEPRADLRDCRARKRHGRGDRIKPEVQEAGHPRIVPLPAGLQSRLSRGLRG